MPRLDNYLVLNRYIQYLLGAKDFESLKNLVRFLPEGPDNRGQSHFFGRLVTQPNLQIDRSKLEQYDLRVMNYEDRLRKARREFGSFRYFQYLALLYTEIFLDCLTQDPQLFAIKLNEYLGELRRQKPDLAEFPKFEPGSLRRLAFFMATGSGKTLLMHVNVWQVLYYLQHGRYPEAILPGKVGSRQFDNILLITPGEGLSAQHLAELQQSSFDAALFIEDQHSCGTLFSPKVKVIEIHKLAEESSRDGVSVVLEDILGNNLVIVDEGHKGTSSDGQTWKRRQKYLSHGGFLLEYSATFAQAIASSGKKAQEDLLNEYGQAILFDYSYAHFYGDGYGKDFQILNLQDDHTQQAHELLIGGLLTFYHQLYMYRRNAVAYRPYNLEKPLWVLLGSSVNAMYTRDKTRRSDVAEVVAFLKRFIEDRLWAISVMKRILEGNSGFQDCTSGQDMFMPHIKYLRKEYQKGLTVNELYDQILSEVFRGSGGLEIWEIKQAEGELGLRLSTANDKAQPYFGVINIGDAPEFKRYLDRNLDIEVREDDFRPSQFNLVDTTESPISILIGAKKFIEGWSSWRVSSMGLLNIGKGAGSQIIQLFGRGVRLKGKDMSLKRSSALQDGEPPEGIHFLETLTIFGWNANYIETFRSILDNENLGKELTLRVQKMTPWPTDRLPVPDKTPGFDCSMFTWVLDTSAHKVELDLTPRLSAMTSNIEDDSFKDISGRIHGAVQISLSHPVYSQVIDTEALYLEALDYKQVRNYTNLYISPQSIDQIAKTCCHITILQNEICPERLQQGASQALKVYLDRFVRMKEREIESQDIQPGYLLSDDSRILDEYRIRIRSEQLVSEIENIVRKRSSVYDEGKPLPRLYFDHSLFNPLLCDGGKDWEDSVSVQPPALNIHEQQFIRDLRDFWKTNHSTPKYKFYELYVLRNVAKTGIKLFYRSDFYPDFIVWLRHIQTGVTHVYFIDPHGLHHDGLTGSEDKFAALKSLRRLGERPEFKDKQIQFSGFIITSTKIEHIRDAAGRSKQELEQKYPLLFQEGHYIKKILESLQ